MNPNMERAVQDFSMTQMTGNKSSADFELEKWMKCEGISEWTLRESNREKQKQNTIMEKVRKSIKELTKPARKNIANALIVLANRIEAA